jgi:dipeptidyl aminopeptidase/acylaminoacyl peptidase
MNIPPRTRLASLALILLASPFSQAQDEGASQQPPTLEQITAEQDWIARSPKNPRWLVDGSAIKFSTRREGLVGRDFSDEYLIFLTNTDANPAIITPENPGPYFTNSGDWNADASSRLLSNNGDLFLYDATAASTTQLTKTSDSESSAFFLSDSRTVFTRFAFSRNGKWFIRNLDSGYEFQAADIRFTDAPKDNEDKDLSPLEQQQRDLFQIFNLEDQRKDMRQEDRTAWRDSNPTSVPGPFYMGKNRRSQGTSLSPSANHILVTTAPSKRSDSKNDIMPNYVTDDGYVSTRSVRTKVGYQPETPVQLALLDLKAEKIIDLPLNELPTITDNPLAWLAESESDEVPADTEDATTEPETDETKPDKVAKPRPVSSMGTRWSDSGRYAAVMLISHDNKDRWIVLVDTASEEPALTTAHHLRDEAWIGWGFNSFGFIPTTDTLYYLSEESGYGHLYTRTPEGTVTQRTNGDFEVRSLTFTNDGSLAYLRTNRTHPGIQELDQLNLKTNKLDSITDLKGTVGSFRLSPDESQAVISYSNINSPPELYLIHLEPNPLLQTPHKQLTHTITEEFEAANFQTPQIIAVPSTHTDEPIYTRLYLPDATKYPGPRPLVVFSHGAGYLQHANYEWSYYSREHMFHTILTNQGFIVVSPDFRASSGYGRDWRTAIYRNMGYPELEDFKDCIDYAVANHNADPENVGVYGGSYGGFMTLMAMFLEPETYKAGAALRSVTDWRHYNHGYTSNILNTPDIDPDAYDISSPINHAEGLQGHLLMLHGMQDDNVVAQDIIRLSQRLIELEKQNWELALAPIEPHGYHEPSSWLDQMRRIHKLFVTNLSNESNN